MAFTGPAKAADTLASVVQQTLETNPELAALRFNRQAIDQELRAARGLYLPTYDVRANTGQHWNSTRIPPTTENTRNWHAPREVSTYFSQRVFDGREADSEVARNKARVESARQRVADTANSIALRAVQSYLELKRAAAVQAAARANLSALQQIASRVRARTDGGRGTAGDDTEAAARVENAKALLAEAEQRLADARALFNSIVGRPPGALADVLAPRKALPRSVDAAVSDAVAFAPSVLATQQDRLAAEAAIGTARSRFFPRVNVELSSDHGKSLDMAHDRQLDLSGLVVVRWNLFNGGIDQARVLEAKARSFEAAEISASTQRVVEREVRVSWNAIQSADQRVRFYATQLQLNRQTRATYGQQFDAGQRRLLDLLIVQNETFVNEASLRTEELVASYNVYRVLAGMGRLVVALGLDLPPEAAMPPAPALLDRWRIETHSVSKQ